MSKTLLKVHEDVPADHYDRGIKYNLFQKYWHFRRFKEVLEVVRPVSGPVFDVGCHSGTFTLKILSKVGSKKIYGIDISEQAIRGAKKKIPYGHFQVADATNLPFKSNFFDAVDNVNGRADNHGVPDGLSQKFPAHRGFKRNKPGHGIGFNASH